MIACLWCLLLSKSLMISSMTNTTTSPCEVIGPLVQPCTGSTKSSLSPLHLLFWKGNMCKPSVLISVGRCTIYLLPQTYKVKSEHFLCEAKFVVLRCISVMLFWYDADIWIFHSFPVFAWLNVFMQILSALSSWYPGNLANKTICTVRKRENVPLLASYKYANPRFTHV